MTKDQVEALPVVTRAQYIEFQRRCLVSEREALAKYERWVEEAQKQLAVSMDLLLRVRESVVGIEALLAQLPEQKAGF